MKTVNGEVQLQALVDGKKIIITEATIRKDLQLKDNEGIDYLPNATIFEQLTLMGYEIFSQKLTFYKAFFFPQWKFLIHTILQCLSAKTTAWNEFNSTVASAIICLATNQKFNFFKYISESTVKNLDNASKFFMYPRQGKDFFGRVKSLFPTMMVQAQEEMGEGSAMSTDPHHTLIITQPSSSQPQKKQKSRRPKRKDTEVPQPSDPTNVADEAVNKEPSMQLKELMDFYTKLQQRVLDLENTKTTQAQEITSLKLRVKRLEKKGGSRTHKLKRLYKVGRSVRVISSNEDSLGDQEDASKHGRKIDDIDKDAEITLVDETQGMYRDEDMFGVHDLDGDEVVVESEVAAKKKDDEVNVIKKKNQISIDEQKALRLQAEFDEEDRLAKEKAQQLEEDNISWDDIQAKIDADYQLAERLQAQKQHELTIEEKSTLFQQLLKKRRKLFAAKRVEEKRNKPPTRAQQRIIMVNTFVDMDTKLIEGSEVRAEGSETREERSSKRAGDELEQEKAKKQKVDEDKETAELKSLMKFVPDEEEVAIDAIPLATKPPSIVDYKIIKEGKISYFKIIRADGSSKRYSAFIQMLRSFDMEDLETLWKLVKAKHGSTRLEEGYERVLWGDLKTMFEHHAEDLVLHVFMLVEKRYPLTPATITEMLNKKLQAGHWNEMCYQLLKLITKQSNLQ
ncbi:hypothetical protein Tco_0702787 [Tanacetum coccineum]|uniref:Synaptobrevin, longin-like domain protein n=1 Tax=Tanacetum coccineum TaxID=301880 RepID=A0ABQ4XYK9_9ASTR